MATFSWSDTARAAFAACFACFPQSRQQDVGDHDHDDQRNASLSRQDELESLLRNPESSDGEMDADAVSLHSDVGNNTSRRDLKRQKRRRRRKNKGTIRLFGYDLFGKAVIQRDADESFDVIDDDDEAERRRVSRLSSSTLDSDPTPVEDDIIARLSSGRQQLNQSQNQAQPSQPQYSQQIDEEELAAKKAARKEKRRQRKLSSALLNTERSVEFEGFQGSGGDGDVTTATAGLNGVPSSSVSSSSGLPVQDDEFGAFQGARLPLPLSPSNPSRTADDFVRVSRDDAEVDDEADIHADFDAGAYVRRNSIASRSDSGSGSRSHTSVSMSRSESQGNNNNTHNAQLHLRVPPSLQDSLSPLDLPITKSSKRSRRSTTSGVDATNPLTTTTARQPRRSRRSTTSGSTTTSSSQPRSPDSLPIQNVRIVQPLVDNHHLRIPQHSPAFEGVPEDDDEFAGSPLPSPLKSSTELSKGFPSPGLSSTVTIGSGSNNGFPSLGFGGRRNSSATANSGVFLARTGNDS